MRRNILDITGNASHNNAQHLGRRGALELAVSRKGNCSRDPLIYQSLPASTCGHQASPYSLESNT